MGGGKFKSSKAKSCWDFIDNMKLIDLGVVGPKFTWNNKWQGWAHVKERLVIAVGTRV